MRGGEGGRGCTRETAGVARALRAVAGAALQASKEYQDALLGGPANHGGSVGGGHRVGEGPKRTNTLHGATGCGGPLPTFQRWGAVGVLNVSVASSQVDYALGGLGAGRRLLSGDAWAWLEGFFRTPEIGWQVRKALISRCSPRYSACFYTERLRCWKLPTARTLRHHMSRRPLDVGGGRMDLVPT